jgi:uncharacterized phiE125 gp8 family phage protein
MRLERVSEPEMLVSLDEAKRHLEVDDSDRDELISGLVRAAVQRLDGADGILGRQLMPADWIMYLPRFPAGPLKIPLPPTIAVQAIDYLDENGALQTFTDTDYRVTGLGVASGASVVLDQITGVTWPAVQMGADPDTVRVMFRAGYQNLNSPADHPVPEPVKLAVLMMVGDWFENRNSSVVGTTAAEMPLSAAALIAPYRTYLADRC